MSQHILSVTDVATICTLAKSTRERTRGEAYTVITACDRRLKQASAGTLALDADVRLPLEAVVRVLWKLRKQALAQWKTAKAADDAARLSAAETSFLERVRESDGVTFDAEFAEA